MKTSNIIIWILLVALTAASFLFSEGDMSGKALVILIMAITVIKFISIGYQFVELKHAHIFWKLIFAGFILLFAVMVYGFV